MSATQSHFSISPVPTTENLDSLSNTQLKTLIEESQATIKVQQAIYQIASIPYSQLDNTQFFKRVHQAIADVISCNNILVAITNKNPSCIDYVYVKNEIEVNKPDQLRNSFLDESDQSICQYILQKDTPLLVNKNKLNELKRLEEITFLEVECESLLGIPITCDGITRGVLAIQSYDERKPFDDKDLALMLFLVNHIATTYNRKRIDAKLFTSRKELEAAVIKQEEKVQQRTNELIKANFELHRQLRENEKSQTRIHHDTLHDNLTGLPSRILFLDRLTQAMARSNSREDLNYAVAIIDLTNFQKITQSFGFLSSDLLLKEIAVRLRNIIRPGDSVSRFGSSEFCILLDGDFDHLRLTDFAERVIDTVSKPFIVKNNSLVALPNLGLVLRQRSYQHPDEIIRDAEAAIFEVKNKSDSWFTIYDSTMHCNTLKRLQLETDLRIAIKENEVEVEYQPIIDFHNNIIVGFEALARWTHHKQGKISPLRFINIAEETDLTQRLGRQILLKSFSAFHSWRTKTQNSGIENIALHINLSPHQLQSPYLVSEILHLLSDHNLSASNLKVEITESALLDNFEIARKTLNNFNDAGVKVVLDDFGSGFSSLNHMLHFPFESIKVEGSFIRSMLTDEVSLKIIKSVKNITAALGIKLIVESVESEEQYQELNRLGVVYGQGHWFNKPVSTKRVLNYLKENGVRWNL